MPGAISLERNEYYAHERNRFWHLMDELFGVPAILPYAERVVALRNQSIGLWDVLQHCTRTGSLDQQIRDAEPNDFVAFFERYPHVGAIALNGQKAASVFARVIEPTLAIPIRQALSVFELPSTSPANAKGGFAALLERWRPLKDWLGRQRSA